MMKKSLFKNNLKSIHKTRRRFISILVMAFLGVGFFAGLVATSPDMLDSLDKYADSSNLYDINIISTLGLTDDDITALQALDGVENAYGIQTKDSISKIDDKESICKVIEYNENVNTPVIISGRNIENENECLIDPAVVRTGKGVEEYIGKKIILENDDLDSNDNPIFTQKEFEIVGIAETPVYISNERGNTSIGNGTVSFYIFTKDVINMDYYTGVYVTAKGAKETVTNSDEYLSIINSVTSEIESIKETRENARYQSLVDEATARFDNLPKEMVDQSLIDSEISKIEKCKWYIQDRLDNSGYNNIFDAIKTMSNISKMFPVIFYIVAVLISLTSMTRMIEEERIEIGTLKALGYTNVQIISKYIIYSLLACIIGGTLGMVVGLYLLPNIVWALYSMIYNIPKFYCSFRFDIGLLGIIISFICIGGATVLVAINELKQLPSVLMRPKPPKKRQKDFTWKNTFHLEKI